MRFLEANIFLRALVEPQTEADSRKAQACSALFRRLAAGDELAFTVEAIITEVAYVLRSRRQYGLTPAEIGARLLPILSLRGLCLVHKASYVRALDLWQAHPALEFEDLLAVADMERLGLKEILSDDVPEVKRVEP